VVGDARRDLGRHFALAFRLADLALSTHPTSKSLRSIRQRALARMREQTEQIAPFELVVYTEWADAEVLPMP
jgi:hypothetical protein